MYYLIKKQDNEIPVRTVNFIDEKKNKKHQECILCPSIYEAKCFLRYKLGIDIVEYPQMNKQGKTYCADIYIDGKLLKHKKYADRTFNTPEEAFENAMMYALITLKNLESCTKIYHDDLYVFVNLDDLNKLNIVKINKSYILNPFS